MSDSFKITTVKLINPVSVALVPEDFLTCDKFEMTLSSDPRFLFIRDIRANSKHPPTCVPLTNVAYMLLDKFFTANQTAAPAIKAKK